MKTTSITFHNPRIKKLHVMDYIYHMLWIIYGGKLMKHGKMALIFSHKEVKQLTVEWLLCCRAVSNQTDSKVLLNYTRVKAFTKRQKLPGFRFSTTLNLCMLSITHVASCPINFSITSPPG